MVLMILILWQISTKTSATHTADTRTMARAVRPVRQMHQFDTNRTHMTTTIVTAIHHIMMMTPASIRTIQAKISAITHTHNHNR